ncbi:MAG: DUF2975 domain-containing protein [Clostridia bacterium]|nr:DUF2975 domain-containing protein [Clostridia bacterium]
MTQKASRLLGRSVEYTCDVLMAVAALAVVTLPWSVPFFTHHLPGEPGGRFFKYTVVLAISGILAILILWQARGVMRHVNAGTPFVSDTVRRLRTGAFQCLALAVFYLGAIFWVRKLYMVVVLVAFCLIGLLLLVLAEMIRQAIAFKEENDMTI